MITSVPSVAVIDDDASVRRGLARLLRAAGYSVDTFSSAADFLARAGSTVPPACLVLDVSMPGQTGIRLHDDLRARGEDVPIIYITGHGDTARAARAKEAGACGLLTKPFEDEALLEAIERALGGAAPGS